MHQEWTKSLIPKLHDKYFDNIGENYALRERLEYVSVFSFTSTPKIFPNRQILQNSEIWLPSINVFSDQKYSNFYGELLFWLE